MLSEGRNEITGFPKPGELAPSAGVTHAQGALKTPKCERIPEDARAVLVTGFVLTAGVGVLATALALCAAARVDDGGMGCERRAVYPKGSPGSTLPRRLL